MLDELLEGTGAQHVNDVGHETLVLTDADVHTIESPASSARKNDNEIEHTARKQTDSASATDLSSTMDAAAARNSDISDTTTTVTLASESVATIDAAATVRDDATVSLTEVLPAPARAVDEHAVVAFVNTGGSVSAAAAKFGLSRTDVSRIVKDAATSLVNAAEHSNSTGSGSGESGSDPDETEDEREETTRKRKTRDVENDNDGDESHTVDDMSAASDASSSALDAANRAKRVRKPKDEKLAILHFVEHGGTHGAAAEKFGLSRTAVTKMVKEREQIWSNSTSETTTTTVATAAAVAAASALPVAIPVTIDQSVPLLVVLDPAMNSSTTTASAPGLSSTTPSSALMTKRGAATTFPITISTAATAHRKGKRVRKTNVEKLEILAFVEQGGSQGAAAEKFGVSRTAVTKMVKEKEAIAAQANSESSTHRKVLQYQHKLSIIEDMLYKWQVQVEFETPSLKVTGELLQTKAMEFRNKILMDFSADLPDDVVVSLTDFKASNGWLHRYTQRRNVRSLSKHEHHSIAGDATHVTKRMEAIRAQLAHAPLACIWNIDEAIVRHRTTSGRPDAPVNLDGRSHEKLTVTFGVSAAGEKLALHAIGASSEPTSLKDLDPVLACGVAYHAQRKACQDSSTTLHYVNRMNHEARARKQVWYVLLDNCPSHMAAASLLDPTGSYDAGFRVDSVVLLVLPPQSSSGTSTSVQPLQLDVIRSWKLAFRREMLQTILDEYTVWQSQATTTATSKPVFDVHAVTHTRNALLWLQSAWHTVSATAIRHAWTKSHYLPPHLLAELGGDDAAQQSVDTTVYATLLELLAVVATKRELASVLGLDTVASSDMEQLALELVSLDAAETTGASSDDANDDEIVIESLSAQGLIRESQRVTHGLLLDAAATATPDIASLSDACVTVEKLLRFLDKTSHEPLVPATDRRAGRSNLLGLHRILLKARAKERSSTAYTV